MQADRSAWRFVIALVRHAAARAGMALMAGAASLMLTSATLSAQAFSYPSMQLPTVSNRDYTFAVAASKGTVALFQWREGINDDFHFSIDGGIGDPEGRNNSLMAFGAAALGAQLLRANKEQPLDLLLTGGFGLALGGGATLVRMPVGVSMGHRFPLDAGMAITPYVHPRVSLDLCTSCTSRNTNNSELSLNFDMGVNFEVSPKFAVRMAGSFSGSELLGRNDSFAIGINWIPMPLKRQ
jgi:hypothetical protein